MISPAAESLYAPAMSSTIFALSSGPAPAAIAVVRISGPEAGSALLALARKLPEPRLATLSHLRDPVSGDLLDHAITLWLPGPRTVTGEDIVELHLHGGRAVVAKIEQVLATIPGLRRARAGEFTRRGFQNGRIDLAEAEGLADLLTAETELQRRAALAMASGALSRQSEAWRRGVLDLAASVEAGLDFADEEDAEDLPADFYRRCRGLSAEIIRWASRPEAETLREGFTVVLAGPPNSGKSTLFNALTDSEAAITSPTPGTTRDLIMRSVSLEGVPFRFVDTAGLRDEGSDDIERIGMARARDAAASADLVLWLGRFGECPGGCVTWEIAARQDCKDADAKPAPAFPVSARTGAGLASLRQSLLDQARSTLAAPGDVAISQRQRSLLTECAEQLSYAAAASDLLIIAEYLRAGRAALDALVGRTGTEAMLDALFARFCIGK